MANKDAVEVVVKEEPVCWEDDDVGDIYACFGDNAALKQEPYWDDEVGVNVVLHEEEEDGSPVEDDNPKYDPVDPEFVNVGVVKVEPTEEMGALMSVDPLRVRAVECQVVTDGDKIKPVPIELLGDLEGAGCSSAPVKSSDDAEMHTCSSCDKSFPLFRDLAAHVEQDGCKRSLTCPVCDEIFTNKPLFDFHVKYDCNPNKRYCCSKCKKKFGTISSLIRHESTDCDRKKLYKCDKCNKTFTLLTGLMKHSRQYCRPPEEIQCPQCNLSFPTRGSLRSHRAYDCGPNRPYVCDKCHYVFWSQGNLVRHAKHTCSRALVTVLTSCKKCDKKYYSRSDMYSHMKHDCGRTEPHKCGNCGKEFLRWKYLVRHRKAGCDTWNSEGSDCPTCGRTFRYRRSFLVHMNRKCKGEEPFNCKLCKRTFTSQTHLQKHMELDCSIQKSYECASCNRIFRTKRHLKEHFKGTCNN